jgi:hypothetical protein
LKKKGNVKMPLLRQTARGEKSGNSWRERKARLPLRSNRHIACISRSQRRRKRRRRLEIGYQ